MELLKFKNPIFHDGLNVTVRLGTKWDKFFYKHNSNLDPKGVMLADENNNTVKPGVIEAVNVNYFTKISNATLKLEHDPLCRDLNGLYKAMKAAYGDRFTANSLVTIVFFSVNGDTNNLHTV